MEVLFLHVNLTITNENLNNARDVKSSGFISKIKAYPNNGNVNHKREIDNPLVTAIIVNAH